MREDLGEPPVLSLQPSRAYMKFRPNTIKGVKKMLRLFLALLFVILFLLLSLPILGIEWILSKYNRHASDLRQLRMVQWAFRVI